MQSEPGAGRETCPLTSLELLAKSTAARAQQTGGGDADAVPTSLSWSQPKGGPQAAAPAQPPAAAEQRPRSHGSVCALLCPAARPQLSPPAPSPGTGSYALSLHSAQTPFASGKGPAINLTYYLGKVTARRLPAKSDSTASGEPRLQGQASDCLGKSRAFRLSSPGGSRQPEPRPGCGKQGSFKTVPTHGAEAQGNFQAGWRVIGPDC